MYSLVTQTERSLEIRTFLIVNLPSKCNFGKNDKKKFNSLDRTYDPNTFLLFFRKMNNLKKHAFSVNAKLQFTHSFKTINKFL